MLSLKVEGMTCGHCVKTVTKAVQTVAPAAEVIVDLPTGMVTVEGDDRRDVVAAAIEGFSYKVAA